jgi:signal recognition particle receptor subunit beta
MAKVSRDATEVNARILYWGCEGAGKSANLRAAFAKLRPDHRAEIKQVPTRIDPTVGYELLPITLGEIAGTRTQIEMVAVPGHREQTPTRKQLLDQVDGVVFVADARPERAEANLASLRELRQSLAAYGRRLEQVPLVVQYNQRDRSDPYAIEDLHRRLALGSTPVFEAVATEGTGVLQTLSTISKRVIRALRDQAAIGAPEPGPLAPEPGPIAPPPATRPSSSPEPSASERMQQAILEEPAHPEALEVGAATRVAAELPEPGWQSPPGEIDRPRGVRIGRDLSIVSVGEAMRSGDREVVLPLVLGDGSGQTSTLLLTLRLDALVEPEPDDLGGPA